ncbi:MAG TPA: hydroxymethylbilane synthase [Calidithermus sp.]|nr:hydroxymethylbilane synthase [Calidithermus sp.]
MIRLGTRASTLALAQAQAVANRVRALGAEVELVPMRTEGDRRAEARLADLGGKGLFVRDLESALLAGRIDAAVHSLKDLPAEQPAGLELAAFLEREDPRDVLVTRAGGGLEGLGEGAVIGTASLRRQALLLACRPDLRVVPIRGNVDTRLARLERGDWDGVVLAAAGLRRLGLAPERAEVLSPDLFVPAVGQGILTVETRADDRQVREVVAALDDRAARLCARAERAYLRRLGATCATPMAAHAVLQRESGTWRLSLRAVVASEDGRRVLRADAAGAPEEAEALGRGLAEALLAQGAAEVTSLTARPGVA